MYGVPGKMVEEVQRETGESPLPNLQSGRWVAGNRQAEQMAQLIVGWQLDNPNYITFRSLMKGVLFRFRRLLNQKTKWA